MPNRVENCKNWNGKLFRYIVYSWLIDSVPQPLCLQFTYPEFLPSERPEYGTDKHFVLQVAVQLPQPTSVHIMEHGSTDVSCTVNVSHLPPLRMKLHLPPTYPLELPPEIHSLDSVHDWLAPAIVKSFNDRLLTLWDKENVLGIWIDYMRNGELLSLLTFQHSGRISIR